MMENIRILGQCPLFDGVSGDEMEALLGCMGARERRYAKGETILAEGEKAGAIGIVLSGRAQVIREDYYGNRSIMTRLAAGDMFAEAFALSGVEHMPVSVVALEDAGVLLIDAGRIVHTCDRSCGFHSRMIYNLMRILAKKNLLCNQKIEITSKRSTREKLMTYLMMQAKKAGSSSFVIPYDRQELADYLEVERSGLSMEISRLRKEGVLLSEKNRFTLLGTDHR